MKNKRYKPKLDKYFWFIWIPLIIYLTIGTLLSIHTPIALIIFLLTELFCLYFMISSLVGYVELRENSVYIKFGFIIKRDILYTKIRELNKERRVITYSYLSLKNALEHVNIKYNKYDMVTVSVIDNDELIKEINKRKEALANCSIGDVNYEI